jgi:hypothetical protein
LKPVFEIIPEAIFFYQTNLICEISSDGIAYVFKSDIDKKFHGLSVFHFNKEVDIATQLKEIFNDQPLLNKSYKKTFIFYTFAESVLIPAELYSPGDNDGVLNTLYGDLYKGTVAMDVLADAKIYNVYRIPMPIHQAIVAQFSSVSFAHHYSLLIKQGFSDDDRFKVIFYQDNFVVVLAKGGELQLINSYGYQTATDVIYHLKNISEQSNIINPALSLSGMIQKDSDLHKEIHHYFPQITFDELPAGYEYEKRLTELPQHYFSHLFSFALCV